MSKQIKFTPTVWVPEQYYPTPSSKNIPEWYKKTPSYTRPDRVIRDGQTPHTVKKCIPVFDAITAGYTIYSTGDVQISKINNETVYEWTPTSNIAFHPRQQVSLHPLITNKETDSIPKWINPWSIKTPSGYSCLFTHPMHSENNIFTTLSGIVDTDKYAGPVNFPFVLNDENWTGIIPAGTPIVQVIPFKRDSWKMSIDEFNEKNQEHVKVFNMLRSKFFNSYKTQFWTKKEFK